MDIGRDGSGHGCWMEIGRIRTDVAGVDSDVVVGRGCSCWKWKEIWTMLEEDSNT